MGGNTLACLELYSYTYDRRPAIRGGGHDPRAADAAAVKTRLVVVAVVLLEQLGRYHIGREYPGSIH